MENRMLCICPPPSNKVWQILSFSLFLSVDDSLSGSLSLSLYIYIYISLSLSLLSSLSLSLSSSISLPLSLSLYISLSLPLSLSLSLSLSLYICVEQSGSALRVLASYFAQQPGRRCQGVLSTLCLLCQKLNYICFIPFSKEGPSPHLPCQVCDCLE